MREPFVDFSEFDQDKILVDLDGIRAVNPHRFEMLLLDGILFLDESRAVGFKNITEKEFWVRGHFPERPLMPGVLICECAAQLSSYFALTTGMVDEGYVGLGGLDKARFRGPVQVGDTLIMMLRRLKMRRNYMFSAEYQGYVNQSLVAEGLVKGVALGD